MDVPKEVWHQELTSPSDSIHLSDALFQVHTPLNTSAFWKSSRVLNLPARAAMHSAVSTIFNSRLAKGSKSPVF